MIKSSEDLMEEREQRISDAVGLKEPDRVPVAPLAGFFPAKYADITFEEAMYEKEKILQAWTKYIQDFQPDMAPGLMFYFLGDMLETLDCKQVKWPGHGVSKDATLQFIEGEYMKAEEYDEWLYDPTDFLMRKYWPRIFGVMKPFETLPSFSDAYSYFAGMKLASFGTPEVAEAVEALKGLAEKMRKNVECTTEWLHICKRLGFPPCYGSGSMPPFDAVSDFFRGMKGAMLDMYRRPEKLLEAIDKLIPLLIKSGLAARKTGCKRVTFAVHKGLDGFMNLDQFKRFFWPSLRRIMITLIENDLTPCVFWEGNVESRLDIIADIPKGKAVYAFESTDIFKAKDILGETVCIQGNVPMSLLSTGRPEQVKDYCMKLIDYVGRGGGFIMASAAPLDDAKIENVKTMFEFTREYGVY